MVNLNNVLLLFPKYLKLQASKYFTLFCAGNVSMMLGPNKVSGYEQEVAGTILTIALVFGLGTGSLVGPALVQLL